jgi:acetyl esterase/lipase
MSLRAELLRLGLRFFFKRKGRRESTLDAWRKQLACLGRLVPAPPKDTRVRRVDLDGVKAVAVVTPEARGGRSMLYLHGGGHVTGTPVLYRDFIWRLAAAARAQVFIIDFRLAPEHPFPAALEDAVKAYRALVAEGTDPRQMAVVGESSGGGLALALLLKLTGPSLRLNADADAMIRSEEAPRLARYYLAGADPRTPYASPLYGDPTGLPPTLIQVGSDEVLLDDSVRMAERMRAAGCQVELEIWPRMPHAWHLWARLVPEARAAIERIGAFVQSKT